MQMCMRARACGVDSGTCGTVQSESGPSARRGASSISFPRHADSRTAALHVHGVGMVRKQGEVQMQEGAEGDREGAAALDHWPHLKLEAQGRGSSATVDAKLASPQYRSSRGGKCAASEEAMAEVAMAALGTAPDAQMVVTNGKRRHR